MEITVNVHESMLSRKLVFWTSNWKHVIKYDLYVKFPWIFAHNVQITAKFCCENFNDVCQVFRILLHYTLGAVFSWTHCRAWLNRSSRLAVHSIYWLISLWMTVYQILYVLRSARWHTKPPSSCRPEAVQLCVGAFYETRPHTHVGETVKLISRKHRTFRTISRGLIQLQNSISIRTREWSGRMPSLPLLKDDIVQSYSHACCVGRMLSTYLTIINYHTSYKPAITTSP